VASLDDKIDDLYKQPLADFTSSRNALAKSLSGDEAKRVKALAKPTLVPWAVNQVYWRARGAYDRLLKAGERLRKAQIAALEGKSADVRAASDAHRRAIAEAVGEAERLARAAGSAPGPDALTRTFEALSLAPEPPQTPGRLTEALAPAGFEALAGITPASSKSHVPSRKSEVASHESKVASHKSEVARPTAAERRAAEKEAKERAEHEAAARKHEAELRKADAAVTRAEANEKLARATWERAHDALLEARRRRDDLRSSKSQASSLKSLSSLKSEV
jgi:flagellar biosynthesis GTPase FlhF